RRGMGRLGDTTGRVSAGIRRLGLQFLAFGAATLGVRAMGTTLASFEKTMASVEAVTQATANEMAAMRDIARELGATTEFSASQAAEGLRFLGMAGFSTADS